PAAARSFAPVTPGCPLPAFQPRRPLRARVLHSRFPARFEHLAPALAERVGVQVVSMGEADAPRLPGVRQHLHYAPPRPTPDQTHTYLKPLDAAVRRGQAAASRMIEARDKEGLAPDIVICPAASGEGLYVKDVFPQARVLQFCDGYEDGQAPASGPAPGVDTKARLRTRNAAQLLALDAADWGFAPTEWQRSRYPDWARRRITTIPDGIDTARCTPRADLPFRTPAGPEFRKGDPVISFVARKRDPQGGLGAFLGALALMQQARPDLQAVVVVGGEDVPKPGNLDLSRLHVTGALPQDALHALFRVTAAHIHLFHPTTLSRSMLEAMACGAVVVAADTPPVREAIAHGKGGLLVPFADPAAIAAAVLGVVAEPDAHAQLAEGGRQAIVARHDLYSICLPRQLELIERVAAGQMAERE
ncbi:MAG: glycosyltransferase, partial [Roseomonas sp.]|nr:glycosyltransferase [Roseomonas sp.]